MERRLQGGQAAVRCQAFDRHDPRAVGLNREHETGSDRIAIDDNSAGAAYAVFAGDMRASLAQIMAQVVSQANTNRNVCFYGVSIKFKGYIHFCNIPRRYVRTL
jgi:UDP-N-acetylglucosamine enolpyruvyl transferase